jgi:hypothetical protein
MQHYNFALIFVGFQRCCLYLTIIKEFSKSYNVAILPQEIDKKTSSRINNTNNSFLELCKDLGADIIYDQKITADIEILPQTHYSQMAINKINDNIASQKTFWLSGVAMGNAQYEYLFGKKIDKILVIDRQFYEFRVTKFENEKKPKFKNNEILEIGIPYKNNPIFPTPEIDYLIANPTPFSFCNFRDRLVYLENVLSILEKIDENDLVVIKPHNADERADYIVNNKIYIFLALNFIIPFHLIIDRFCRIFISISYLGRISDIFIQISIAIKYYQVMKRAKNLKELTKWHNLNLELFLPNVKKGLITGRSNSIWHGLFLKKPTYNCIDANKPYYSDSKMHKYSMKYFNVHGNYNNLHFDEGLFKRIKEQTRSIDAVGVLKEELETLLKN